MEAAPRRTEGWVSKSDVTGYMRCPYAWYLRERGEVTFEETVGPYQLELIADGQRFHTTTEAELKARRITPDSLPAAVTELPGRSESELWIPTGVVEHPSQKIYGLPDAVVPADGALIPVEIKSHQISKRMDKIELAFYWLLLDGLRTCGHEDPRGILLLADVTEPTARSRSSSTRVISTIS